MDDLEIHFNAPQNASPAELATYLDGACGSDSDLRARVEALFAAGEESRDFMAEAPLSEFSADDDVGEVIDNYKLLQKIGEGGFGAVYMAEQSEPVKRRVALKIIKLGMDTKQVIARFEIERQALAMMDHPNIAKVHDAGATDLGRPFFVMELVRGIPITKFCEEQKLGTRERLELFVDVCSAVQHAHQKGIIHRDLKPSNVMVTLHDDKAVPKVIDFGVAKATQQDLTDKTLFTRFEQFIGTPAYMSPEQAQMSGLDIDTRSDIYSLGALLYELLTGTTPFDARELARAGDREIRRLISEEEPPRPSTRLTQLQGRENQEDLNLPKVTVARDLDWIVMKAMEKDRTRRYDTAKGLGMDLDRFLRNEPIEAAPPGAWYRFQKYARRYRGALGTAAIVALALVVGTVVSVWQAIEADAQRDKSQVAEQREREAKDKAIRLERESRHIAFEELLSGGKQRLGMARLAQLVRDDPDNRIAAARLLSALQFREFPTSIQQGPIAYFPDLSPDRNLVITTTEDEQGFQVWNVLTGDEVGKVLRLSQSREARSTSRMGVFHPSRPLVATGQGNKRTNRGFVQLWNYETGEPKGEPIHFSNSFRYLQFTPDGQDLVTAGYNGKVVVTEVETGRQRILMTEEVSKGSSMVSAAISPDSRSIVLAHMRVVRIIDLATGEVIAKPFPTDGIHWSVDYRPDGKVVAAGGEQGQVRFWNTETKELLPTELSVDGGIHHLEFSSDGRLLATASRSGIARVWDVQSGEVLMETHDHGSLVGSAKFDNSGRFLVTYSEDLLQLWDIGTGELVGAPDQSPMSLTFAAFGPGGDSVFFAGPGGASRLNKVLPGSPTAMKFFHPPGRRWNNGGDLVGSADFSPDGRWIATAGSDDTVRVWDRQTGVPIVEPLLFEGANRVRWVEFSPDGKLLLATCDGNAGIRIWDTSTWEVKCKIPEARACLFAAFAPAKDAEGRWRIINAGSASPQIWDAETGEELSAPLGEPLRVTRTMVDAVQLSADLKWVLTITNGNEALLWDAETSQLIRRFDGDFGETGHLDFLRSVSFSPDNSRILTCGNDETAILWETATGRQIGKKMIHGDDITYAAFSPDGRLVVTVSRDTTARLWDAETGEPVGIPLQHGSWVGHASFDPSSKRVVTASDDGTARVWDCATGLPLSEPLQHGGQVFYVTFSDDGSQVITAGRGGSARLWDVPALPNGAVPEWLGEWAEAIVGLRIESSGAISEVDWNRPEDVETEVRSQADGDDLYERFVDWFYADPNTRPIAPNFELTLEGYVENRMRERDAYGKSNLTSLEEVLRVKPRHVPAYAALAKRLYDEERGDQDANLRRASYYARLAHQARPDDPKMAELSGRVEATLEEKAKLAEISLLEETAAGFIRKGSELQGQLLADQAALALLEKATKERWPAKSERLATLESWLAVQTPQVFVGRGSTWKFNDPAKGMVPDNWKDSDFDDGDWKDGAAPLGFSPSGEDGEVTVLEKGEEGSERVTFYFRHQFEAKPSGEELSGRCLSLRLRRDDGAVIYLNGEEILRSNMSDGKVHPTTFASSVVGGQDEKEFFWHFADTEQLREGENVLAVEVHQANLDSSDVMFDLEMSLVRDPEPFFQSMIRERKWTLEEEAFLNWIIGDEEEALAKVDAVLKSLPKSYDPAEVRRRKDWLRRKASVLYALKRWEEAKSAGKEAMAVPPRDPDLDPKLLDLTRHYHRSWFQEWIPRRSSDREAEEMLAETYHPGGGPEFDLRGYIQLNSGVYPDAKADSEPKDYNARNNKDRPMKVSIPVGQSCRKVHFLHSCRRTLAEPGDHIASYVMHFSDGTNEEYKAFYGIDLVGITFSNRSTEELQGLKHIAWKQDFETGSKSGTLGLTRQTEELRATSADKTITHIDFVSAGAKAAPFLVAVTLE